MNIQVNKNAAAFHEAEILIHAPIDEVYKILSSINDWPNWQTEVAKASMKGKAEVGREFIWKASGMTIRSQIHTANQPNELGWTGKMLWIKAIHNWTFSTEGKSTHVKVEESMEGFLAGFLQKTLEKGMKQNLFELKMEAEKKE